MIKERGDTQKTRSDRWEQRRREGERRRVHATQVLIRTTDRIIFKNQNNNNEMNRSGRKCKIKRRGEEEEKKRERKYT